MPFYVGDIPAEAFIIEPPETIDLDNFTDSEARVFAPNGIDTPVNSTPDPGLDAIVIDFPDDETIFSTDGIYRIRIILTSLTGYRQGMPDVPIVVQSPSSEWHTLDSIRGEWPDAEYISDVSLWGVLDIARMQCLEFAPALADEAPVPSHYREAQRIQARNVWNASKVAPDGTAGQDDFVIRPFPLDWHVKAILRPKRGIGAVA